MAFYNSCRNVRLDGSTLRADCQDKNGSWRQSEINLNDCIGNKDGYFNTSQNRFFETARNVSLKGSASTQLCKTVMVTPGMKSKRLTSTSSSPTTTDISSSSSTCEFFFVFFSVTTLTYTIHLFGLSLFTNLLFFLGSHRHESILKTGSFYHLDGPILRGLVLGYNGKFNVTEIDLNECYANKNGSFQSDDNHFYNSSRNLRLVPSPGALTLEGELRNWYNSYSNASVNLAICIMNNDGKFQFVRQ